jgi:hypothetical protein
MVYTSFCRRLGATLSQYIDDHTVVGVRGDGSPVAVRSALYLLLLCKGVHGGIFFSETKTQMEPTRIFRALGLMVNRGARRFEVPVDKGVEFVGLVDEVLRQLADVAEDGTAAVSWSLLGRVAGKGGSFALAIPRMRLFQNAVYVALGDRELSDTVHRVGRRRVPWWRESEIVRGSDYVGRRVRAEVVPLLVLELRCQRVLSGNSFPHPWVEERRAAAVWM